MGIKVMGIKVMGIKVMGIKIMNNTMMITLLMIVTSGATLAKAQSLQIPATEDIPEEILQTEIILDARSPLDGKPLSAAEYAELQAALSPDIEDVPARLSPKVHRLVVLLKLRKLLSTVFPFLF